MRVPLLFLLLLSAPLLAAAEPFPVSATPERVVLGQDQDVRVRVTVPPGTPPLRFAVSTGSLQPLPEPAPDTREYRWVPPDIRYPLLAVLAFWVEPPRGEAPEVTTLHLPLLGRTTLEIDTNAGAGAEVVVEVADMRFGPVRTNRRGHVQVPVEVPPGVREATVLATQKRKKETRRTTRLDPPPRQPLAALLSPEVLPADGDGWLVVLGEAPVPLAELSLRVQGARVEQQAPGVFRVKVEPGASTVQVDARRKDGHGEAHVSARVEAPVAQREPVIAPEPPPPLQIVLPKLELPPPAPVAVSQPLLDWHNLSFQLQAGGFFAGGDNLGPLLSLGLGYRLPPLGGRFTLEAETGLRQSRTQPNVDSLGTLNARLRGLPVMLSVRVLAYERGPLSLHGRVGAGVMVFEQQVTSEFFANARVQREQTFTGFAAAQAAWRFGTVSALFEIRGSYAAAKAMQIDAQLGGLSASVGVRYAL